MRRVFNLGDAQQLGDSLGKGAFGQVYREFEYVRVTPHALNDGRSQGR